MRRAASSSVVASAIDRPAPLPAREPSPREPTRSPRGDLRILFATRTARAFGAGALSVALALDLSSAYGPVLAGVLLGVSMAAAAAWSVGAERIERRTGRTRAFVLSALGVAAGGFLLFEWIRTPYVVGLALLLGGILASATDLGPLPALEQAALASVVTDETRTGTFSHYNLLGYLGGALGSLLAAPLMAVGGTFLPASNDLVLLLYGLLGLSLVPAYLRFSERADRLPQVEPRRPLSPESRPRILALSGLFSVDAFGGGLVANFLVTLWFRAHYHASGEVIGLILAVAMVGAAVSLLLAAPLARRFGLINTMVFTHLPSSLVLILFPFAPTLALASGLWVGRSLISQMDVPTRQSFIQAIVSPPERTAAAGYTTAARSTSAFGGPLTGAFLTIGGPWVTAPFLLAGSAKIAYDAALYSGFRRIRVPEEAGRPEAGPRT